MNTTDGDGDKVKKEEHTTNNGQNYATLDYATIASSPSFLSASSIILLKYNLSLSYSFAVLIFSGEFNKNLLSLDDSFH